MLNHKLPILCITPGDPEGIGPEIVLKFLKDDKNFKTKFRPLIIGDFKPFSYFIKKNKTPVIHSISEFSSKNLIHFLSPKIVPNTVHKKNIPGWISGWSIKEATELCLKNKTHGLVTGPIDKFRLQNGGFPYFGHTDFLADLCQVKSVTMMLANSKLKVSLVTVHCALKKVSSLLSEKKIIDTVLKTNLFLTSQLGISHPKIAVLSLNPHSGEKGLMGNEEQLIITPAIKKCAKLIPNTLIQGPFPSDTFFAENYKNFDAVVAMYHDQGLIPVKMIDFENTVNLTLGLPIIRTSVDHGTAFDIVGKGIANPSSLFAAIKLALKMIKNRKERITI